RHHFAGGRLVDRRSTRGGEVGTGSVARHLARVALNLRTKLDSGGFAPADPHAFAHGAPRSPLRSSQARRAHLPLYGAYNEDKILVTRRIAVQPTGNPGRSDDSISHPRPRRR